jgi:hypothetical protein
MDKEIKKYIEKQKSPQKKILKKIRRLILKTLPGCEEKPAWGVIAFAGGKFYLAAIKDRVHVGFAINGLSKKEIALFEGSGKTMRHIKIHSLEDIDEKNLARLLKMVNKKAVCHPC